MAGERAAFFTSTHTPLGRFFVASTDEGLVASGETTETTFVEELFLTGFDNVSSAKEAPRSIERILNDTVMQLEGYFAGSLRQFDVPIDLRPATAFTRSVLEEVAYGIPFGTVLTYGEVAERVGRPRAARAVGSALARSPLSVIIPCHRVVQAGGKLGEYNLTDQLEGRRRKLWLLQHEGVVPAR